MDHLIGSHKHLGIGRPCRMTHLLYGVHLCLRESVLHLGESVLAMHHVLCGWKRELADVLPGRSMHSYCVLNARLTPWMPTTLTITSCISSRQWEGTRYLWLAAKNIQNQCLVILCMVCFKILEIRVSWPSCSESEVWLVLGSKMKKCEHVLYSTQLDHDFVINRIYPLVSFSFLFTLYSFSISFPLYLGLFLFPISYSHIVSI